jgi:hypothetical protein
MALVSFTVRNTIANGGSALRRTNVTQNSGTPDGSGTAVYDSALRADGYFPPAPQAYLQSSFSANIYVRGEIELQWELETSLVSSASGSDFEPVELLIRASEDGEPVTPADGFEIVRLTADSDPYFESYIDVAGPSRPYIAEGKWAYYSLFVKYANNTGDSYYENLADLSVQTPINFGSTEELWKHIPEYYRQTDEEYMLATENYSYDNGPLYRFIELFGWELDKMRTTIYDTMRINDPSVVHSSAIDSLANQTGVEFNKSALGTAKLRAILNNIGYLRRTKGTINSIEAYISAMSGCGVTTNTAVSPIEFNVHPMRVNLFSDPFFAQSSTTTDTTGVIRRKFGAYNASGRQYGWGVFSNQPAGIATGNIIDVTDGVVTVTLAAGSGTSNIYIYSRGAFTYNNNLTYYASAQSSHDFVTRFTTAANMLSILETASDSSTTDFVAFDDWNDVAVASAFPTFLNPGDTTRKITASIPNTTTVSPTSVVGVFKLSVAHPASGTTTITFSKPLFEYKNSSGVFFTGSEPMGGFIPRAGVAGDGLYDYHWGSNAVSSLNTDFSYYTLDYHRTKVITDNIVTNYVAPVTLVYGVDYEINWEVLE